MGTVYAVRCDGCGYHNSFFSGGGMGDCFPENLLSAVGGSPKLEAAVREGRAVELCRFPAFCPRCATLCTGAEAVWTEDGAPRTAAKLCPDCGGELTLYRSGEETVPCPRCGKPLPLIPSGHWD